MFNFLRKHRRLFLIAAMAAMGIFGAMPGARAGFFGDMLKNTALSAVGGIVQIWVWVIGQLVVQLVYLIIYLASYNNFVHSSAVENGWVIIRDVVNMFFIVILLVIAFSTMFNIKGNYSYKQLLPRLLIMAVVINFSRTICGILIDLGQVVMLTFVNGFQAAAGGNFMKALKIEELTRFKVGAGMQADDTSFTKVLASFMLAAIMITITAVVLGAFAIMLVMRMVTLWFLVVLSPIAFLASALPSFKKHYDTWWSMFTENILVGPILAFFLWLSLLVLGNGNISTEIKGGGTYKEAGEASLNQPSTGYTQIGTTENMLSYILGIGMLLGSLYMTQSMKSAGGGIAGKALGEIKGRADKYARMGGARLTGIRFKGAEEQAEKSLIRRGANQSYDAALGGVVALTGGRIGLKTLGERQKKQQQKAKDDSAYISGLTPEQRALRLKQLERQVLPHTDSQKNQLGALYKERLGDLGKKEWKPDAGGKMDGKTKDEWYKGKQEEFAKIEKFSAAYANKDPDFRKRTHEFEDQRMDFLSDSERKKKASELSTLQAASMSTKVLQNDDVVEHMGQDNRDYVWANGGKARKDLIEAWERRNGKTRAGTPTPVPASPTTPGVPPTTPPVPPTTPPPPVPPTTPGVPPTTPPVPPTTPPPPATPPPTPSKAARPSRPTGGGTPPAGGTPPPAPPMPPVAPPPVTPTPPVAPPPATPQFAGVPQGSSETKSAWDDALKEKGIESERAEEGEEAGEVPLSAPPAAGGMVRFSPPPRKGGTPPSLPPHASPTPPVSESTSRSSEQLEVEIDRKRKDIANMKEALQRAEDMKRRGVGGFTIETEEGEELSSAADPAELRKSIEQADKEIAELKKMEQGARNLERKEFKEEGKLANRDWQKIGTEVDPMLRAMHAGFMPEMSIKELNQRMRKVLFNVHPDRVKGNEKLKKEMTKKSQMITGAYDDMVKIVKERSKNKGEQPRA